MAASQEGYEYHLVVQDASFYARGLDAADRVRRRLQAAVDRALAEDHEVLRSGGAFFRVHVDKRYFAEPKEES
jgi:hypothetical protein